MKKFIVIGAGLGGISAAISLKTEGHDVVIFEKNSHTGGRLNIHNQEGFSFDLGPSIIIMPEIFKALFRKAGKNLENYMTFEELNPQWRNFWPDGTVLDLHSEISAMEKELRRLGPEAGDGFFNYVEYSRKLFNYAEKSYFKPGNDTFTSFVKNQKLLDIATKTEFYRSMQSGVDKFVKNPYLRDMLGFFIKYVGSSSHDAPGVLNLLLYSQLEGGLQYVKGGLYNMARGFSKLLSDMEIPVFHNSKVVEIIRQGDLVKGIVLENGEKHFADAVISNLEIIPAMKTLLGNDPKHVKKLDKFKPACSGLVIHLGVKGTYPQLTHHNFFFSKSTADHFKTIFHDGKLPSDPTTYLVCPTVSDKSIAPEGHSIIKILPHVPVLPEDGSLPDYRALEERVYDKLEEMGLVDLRKRTVYKNVLTPADIHSLYGSNRGAIYGVVSDLKMNLGFKAPRRSTMCRNLYFTGGSVNPGPGTPMVTLCGQILSAEIINDINKGEF